MYVLYFYHTITNQFFNIHFNVSTNIKHNDMAIVWTDLKYTKTGSAFLFLYLNTVTVTAGTFEP
jgi:hypothetical protein